jgi:hypothetical protein
MIRTPSLALVAAMASAGAAHAQNVGQVPSPDIEAGEQSLEYRAAYGFEADGVDAFAHRLHYQRSLSGAWRARLIAQQGGRIGEPLKMQSASAELFWQIRERGGADGWSSGFRFDGVLSLIDGRPSRARIGWLNAWQAGDWQWRSNIFVGRDLGDFAKDGVSLEVRTEASRAIGGARIGAQLYDNFGYTSAFGSFDTQRHQFGPFWRGKMSKSVKLEAGALVGLSAAAPDVDFRLIASYGF